MRNINHTLGPALWAPSWDFKPESPNCETTMYFMWDTHASQGDQRGHRKCSLSQAKCFLQTGVEGLKAAICGFPNCEELLLIVKTCVILLQ